MDWHKLSVTYYFAFEAIAFAVEYLQDCLKSHLWHWAVFGENSCFLILMETFLSCFKASCL